MHHLQSKFKGFLRLSCVFAGSSLGLKSSFWYLSASLCALLPELKIIPFIGLSAVDTELIFSNALVRGVLPHVFEESPKALRLCEALWRRAVLEVPKRLRLNQNLNHGSRVLVFANWISAEMYQLTSCIASFIILFYWRASWSDVKVALSTNLSNGGQSLWHAFLSSLLCSLSSGSPVFIIRSPACRPLHLRPLLSTASPTE